MVPRRTVLQMALAAYPTGFSGFASKIKKFKTVSSVVSGGGGVRSVALKVNASQVTSDMSAIGSSRNSLFHQMFLFLTGKDSDERKIRFRQQGFFDKSQDFHAQSDSQHIRESWQICAAHAATNTNLSSPDNPEGKSVVLFEREYASAMLKGVGFNETQIDEFMLGYQDLVYNDGGALVRRCLREYFPSASDDTIRGLQEKFNQFVRSETGSTMGREIAGALPNFLTGAPGNANALPQILSRGREQFSNFMVSFHAKASRENLNSNSKDEYEGDVDVSDTYPDFGVCDYD